MNAQAYAHLGQDECYSQAYATVSAMQTRILKPEDLEPAVLAGDMKEAVAFFDNTKYAQELSSAGWHDDCGEIERALERHFLRAYREATDAVPDADRKSLDGIILGEYDLKNLKSILRRVKNPAIPFETKPMLYFGTIDKGVMEKMAQSGDAGNAFSIITAALDDTSGRLEQAGTEYHKTHSILPLEMALDRMFVDRLPCSGRLAGYAKTRIDVTNLINLFRCRIHRMDYGKHAIPQGMHLDERLLKILAETPASEIPSHLEATPYGPAVRKATHAGGEVDLQALERELDDFTTEEVAVNAIISPLSVWPVVQFINLKQRELRNVKTVLLLKAYGSTPEGIKKLLR
jgi:V/A-type H+-transporting ATPase subunit C